MLPQQSAQPAGSPSSRDRRNVATAIMVLCGLAALAIIVLTVLRAYVFWLNEAYLDDVSGSWSAMASDVSSGILYRPLHGPIGYGGSRYFPLFFVLHGGLIAFIGHPIASGHLVAALAMALLVGGVYVLSRRLGAPHLLAASCAAFVLVARPAQEAVLAIKGDGLAAALNVWGMALCIGGAVGAPAVLGAAVLFALAFASKVTTVSGVGAAAVWLWATGRRPLAALCVCASAAGMLLVLALMYMGSHGVVVDILRASASAGATAHDILVAPMTLARQARRVPETLVFIQLGFTALVLLLLGPLPLKNPAVPFFICVLGITVVIFGSPGTDTNHLLDLHVASVVLVVSWLTQRKTAYADFGGAALLVAALAASLSLVSGLVNAQAEQRRGTFAQALALIPDRSKPILAQNPMLPLAAGQRPYLADPFLIRLNVERDPAFGEPLWSDIRSQKFGAVIFEADPRQGRARDLYRVILGERFVSEVEQSYAIAGTVGARVIYLPQPR